MWHPDRAGTDQERTIAEAELKKVNGARDLIQRHYQDGLHRLVGCECSSEPVQDPRGSVYEGTSRTTSNTPPPAGQNGAQAKPGGAGMPRKAGSGAKRRRQSQQTAPPVVASIITAAMVLLAMFIVKTNSAVRLDKRQADSYGYDSAPAQSWRTSTALGNAGVSSSTIASLRPSLTNKAATTSISETVQEPKKVDDQKEEALAKERAKEQQLQQQKQQQNRSMIEFVSADGRLISLQDGTTWELWPHEAADSFFAWQPGDRITVKGRQTSMPWLVNDSRSHQAVKVTRVE